MAQGEDDIRKLERALLEAYRMQPEVRGEAIDVTGGVMRDIIRLPGDHGSRIASAVLDQLVWRTATMAAAVVLLMTVLTVGVFRLPAEEGAVMLAEEFEPAPLFGD